MKNIDGKESNTLKGVNIAIVRPPKWVFQVHLYMNTEWDFFPETVRGVPWEQF